MRRNRGTVSPPIRRKPWTQSELAILVEHRLLDFFPSHHEGLMAELRRSAPDQGLYLDVLQNRGTWDHFGHWVALTGPFWKSFDWKKDSSLERVRLEVLRRQSSPFVPTKQVHSGWEDDGPNESPYTPPRPTMSEAQAHRALEDAKKFRFSVRGSADEPDWTSRPNQECDLPALNLSGEEYRLPLQFYLRVSPEEEKEKFGHLYSYLYLSEQAQSGHPEDMVPEILRSIWPPILQLGEHTLGTDYRLIKQLYRTKLNLPEEYFKSIVREYWWGKASTGMRKAEHQGSPAIRLAMFMEHILPSDYRAAYDHIRLFRRDVLPDLRTKPNRTRTPGQIRKLVREFRGKLEADPLLNAVFHREVLEGHSDSLAVRRSPGPEEVIAEAWATRVAVDGFKERFVRGAPTRVVVFFKNAPDLSRALRRQVDKIEGRSSFDYASPLLSALYFPPRIVTPDAVKSTYHRQRKRKRHASSTT